jgi:hypothetical protein
MHQEQGQLSCASGGLGVKDTPGLSVFLTIAGARRSICDEEKREAIKRRDHGDETLAEIGRAYNVSGWMISRLRIL